MKEGNPAVLELARSIERHGGVRIVPEDKKAESSAGAAAAVVDPRAAADPRKRRRRGKKAAEEEAPQPVAETEEAPAPEYPVPAPRTAPRLRVHHLSRFEAKVVADGAVRRLLYAGEAAAARAGTLREWAVLVGRMLCDRPVSDEVLVDFVTACATGRKNDVVLQWLSEEWARGRPARFDNVLGMVLGAWYCALGASYPTAMLDARCCMLDVECGCWMLDASHWWLMLYCLRASHCGEGHKVVGMGYEHQSRPTCATRPCR